MAGPEKYKGLKREPAFVLYGMMALAARFSSLPYLSKLNAKERGGSFALKAWALYQDANLTQNAPSSLTWLQGCILLASYFQWCRPQWMPESLTPTCINLAQLLRLQNVDSSDSFDTGFWSDNMECEDWTVKEEKRRAWWAVWELETFESVTSFRASRISLDDVHVKLPVSDEVWHKGVTVASARLDPELSKTWKSLRDSPNQNPRAWYLISKYILAQGHSLAQRRCVEKDATRDLDTAITCFHLLFFDIFHNQISDFSCNENNYAECNWLTMTGLMIQTWVFGLSFKYH